jgi:hypothetical protein
LSRPTPHPPLNRARSVDGSPRWRLNIPGAFTSRPPVVWKTHRDPRLHGFQGAVRTRPDARNPACMTMLPAPSHRVSLGSLT